MRDKEGRRTYRRIESSTEKWVEQDEYDEEDWEEHRWAPPHSVVGWQSTPPEATAVIKAVIDWTHIFISYWFISNSPLISGGHCCTVAFLLPRLRPSAPPDITVVITALPPRKLFTVSYCSKNWMSILEEKRQTKGREGRKNNDWKGEIKDSEAITHRPAVWQNWTTMAVNSCHCAISALTVRVLDLFKAPCVRYKHFPQRWGERVRRVITTTSDWADDSTSSLTNLENNARVRKHKLTVHYTLYADGETSPVHCILYGCITLTGRFMCTQTC